MKLVAIGENGHRIGEDHQRAKFSDHDIALIQSLLDARTDAIETAKAAGVTDGCMKWHLNALQLSYAWIARKMECSKSQVKSIADGRVRCQVAVGFKRVHIEPKA